MAMMGDLGSGAPNVRPGGRIIKPPLGHGAPAGLQEALASAEEIAKAISASEAEAPMPPPAS
eukprot:4404625-Lingulodinium_polyedra.AAC.1